MQLQITVRDTVVINVLVGSPGGGKSYEAVVYHLLPALISGRMVITNLPVNFDYIVSIDPQAANLLVIIQSDKDNPFPFSQIEDYGSHWRHPETGSGPLYIIDECHKCIPAGGRVGDRTATQPVREWYAEHRHELADVLLVTQSVAKIHRDITDQIQLQYKVRKNIALGSSGTYTRKVIDGIRGETVNTTQRTYKKKHFKLYKSHTKSTGSGVEESARDIKPIWMHWSVIGAAACFVFAIYAAVNGWLNPFSASDEIIAKTAQPAVHPAPVSEKIVTRKVVKREPEYDHKIPEAVAQLDKPAKKTLTKSQIDGLTHPLSKLSVHISAHLKATADGHYLYSIVAAQNGQPVFSTDHHELVAMGYIVTPKSACLLQMTWGDHHQWVTCDSPKISLTSQSSF